jgi:hypothetical protein
MAPEVSCCVCTDTSMSPRASLRPFPLPKLFGALPPLSGGKNVSRMPICHQAKQNRRFSKELCSSAAASYNSGHVGCGGGTAVTAAAESLEPADSLNFHIHMRVRKNIQETIKNFLCSPSRPCRLLVIICFLIGHTVLVFFGG